MVSDILICVRVVIWLICVAGALQATGCGASSVNTASNASGTTTVARLRDSGRVRLYRVPSGSMEPTFHLGTKVVVEQATPAVGAVVVVYPPRDYVTEECGPTPHVVKPGGAACDTPISEQSRVETIKRIVAGPGDVIYVRGGYVYRKANGSGEFIRENEPYIRACGTRPECDFPVQIKIPADHWFLMGDNRGESDDSRFWGPVPTTWIVGIATNYSLKGRRASVGGP